jgi:hypothetical protein
MDTIDVDVVVDREWVSVVESETGRVLNSVRQKSTESVWSVIEHLVNARISPLRKRAP